MSNFKEQSFPMPVHSNSDRLIGFHHQNKLFDKLAVIVTLLSFFLYQVAFAQREKIDSLKKVLPLLHDHARANCLYWLTQAYISLRIWIRLVIMSQKNILPH